jgi:hypothetical protein
MIIEIPIEAICECDKPERLGLVYPLPDICTYCKKIIDNEYCKKIINNQKTKTNE